MAYHDYTVVIIFLTYFLFGSFTSRISGRPDLNSRYDKRAYQFIPFLNFYVAGVPINHIKNQTRLNSLKHHGCASKNLYEHSFRLVLAYSFHVIFNLQYYTGNQLKNTTTSRCLVTAELFNIGHTTLTQHISALVTLVLMPHRLEGGNLVLIVPIQES